jgi:hypothetical protein
MCKTPRVQMQLLVSHKIILVDNDDVKDELGSPLAFILLEFQAQEYISHRGKYYFHNRLGL